MPKITPKLLDEIFEGIELPSNETLAEDVAKFKRAEGLKNPTVRKKIGSSLRSSQAFKTGIANRDQSFREDPQYQKQHKKRMQDLHKTKSWQENHAQGIKNLRNDPQRYSEYLKKQNQGNAKKLESDEFWKAYRKGIKKRESNEEYCKERIEKTRKAICVKIHAGELGVFDSYVDAARAHGWFGKNGYPMSERARHRCKSDTYPDWYVIKDEVLPQQR